jgi:hypothetical protein
MYEALGLILSTTIYESIPIVNGKKERIHEYSLV